MNKYCKELLEIDKQFCKESVKDKETAWKKYLSKEAIMGTPKHEPYIEQRNQMVQLISMVYQLDHIDFTWEPVHAFISEDHTLGVTTGLYKRRYKIEEEPFEQIGKYMTVWKKIDGLWKIVFDMGN